MFIKSLLEKDIGVYTFFGVPGSGKTTFAAAICHAAQLKGYPVYSNVPIIGAYEINKSEIGHYKLPLFNSPIAVLIVDEAGAEFNNRDYKSNFDYESLRWWLRHRHYRTMIYTFAQGIDHCDKKIRNITQQFFTIKRKGNLIYATPIYYDSGVNEEKHEMQDMYFYDESKLSRIFNRTYIWGKKYWKMFDTYEAPYLPDLRLRRYQSSSSSLSEVSPDNLSSNSDNENVSE